jgi:hypothetical protein
MEQDAALALNVLRLFWRQWNELYVLADSELRSTLRTFEEVEEIAVKVAVVTTGAVKVDADIGPLPLHPAMCFAFRVVPRVDPVVKVFHLLVLPSVVGEGREAARCSRRAVIEMISPFR